MFLGSCSVNAGGLVNNCSLKISLAIMCLHASWIILHSRAQGCVERMKSAGYFRRAGYSGARVVYTETIVSPALSCV
jgi:hypothetical protein